MSMNRANLIPAGATAVALLFLSPCVAGAVPGPGIIPAPASCKAGTGSFTVDARTRIGFRNKAEAAAARVLRDGLRERTGLDLATGALKEEARGAAAIVLELTPDIATHPASAEAYWLEVAPSAITVRAGTDAGLFYGVQSLLQMADSRGADAGPPFPRS